ncbi:MAG: ester cyclase [Chloroflexota bacterium]
MNEQDRNKEAVRKFFREIWCEHDESAIDRYIAADAAGNDATFGIGRESFRKQWKKWLIGFPDLCLSVEELVAEGDTVVSRWTLTGMSLDHLKDGVVVAGCDGWDSLGFRQQIGMVPPDPEE